MTDNTYCADIATLVTTGWTLRDQLVRDGAINPMIVTLENALHHLESSLSNLGENLSAFPDGWHEPDNAGAGREKKNP
jgi:hypothetical protein